MNIPVIAPQRVLDQVHSAFSKLNLSSGNDAYNFTPSSEYLSSEHINSFLHIHLILEEDDKIYETLAGEAFEQSICLIDNGGCKGISNFIEDNRLTARVIGAQEHNMIPGLIGVNDDKILRLKDVRARPDLSETVFRTSEKVIFNFNVIRRGDQIGCASSNTTGLKIEEACLVAKYIGASDLVTELYITGFSLDRDPYDMIQTNLANLLWYLAEGSSMRNIEMPVDSPDNLHFSVIPDGYNIELDFVKSAQSGRWWLKVPTEDGPMYMACTKSDYDEACQNKLSERILTAYKIV